MIRRQRALFAFFLVALLGGFTWLLLHLGAPEPVYQGQSLTHWTKRLSDMTSDDTDPYRESYWVGERPVLEIGPPAIPFLIKTLRRKDSVVNELYVSLWPKLPKSIQRHLSMPVARASMRDNAARGLKLFGPEAVAAVPDLIVALHDKDKWARSSAADAFQTIGSGGKAAVPFLIQGLSDPDASMQLACLIGLSGAGRDSPEVVPALQHLLKNKDPNTRGWAATGLGKMTVNREAVLESLQEALQDDVAGVRQGAAQALGHFGAAASVAVPSLLRRLQLDETHNTPGCDLVVRRILETLGQIGPEARAAIPALTNRLNGKLSFASVLSAGGLWAIQPHNSLTVPCLMEALKTGTLGTPLFRALGTVGPDALDALPLLQTLERQDLGLQMETTVAAWKIKPDGPPPLKLLVNTYHSKEHSMVRRNAIELLGELGPAAHEAIPTLIEATKDRDELTREFATEALNKVRHKD